VKKTWLQSLLFQNATCALRRYVAVEQSILVDFAQFPDKFIELLEECISSKGEEQPRFLAVLRVGMAAHVSLMGLPPNR
jgi:hypothetical protein